jgi:hypothetical protein
MPYYKDEKGGLHVLDDPRFEYLLPPGTVPISDEEGKAIEESNKLKETNA